MTEGIGVAPRAPALLQLPSHLFLTLPPGMNSYKYFKTTGSRNTTTPYKSANISFYTGKMNVQKNRTDNMFVHGKDPFSSQGIIKRSAQGNKYFLSVGIPIALPLQTNHWLAGDTGLMLSLSLLGSSFEHLQHQSIGPDLSDKPDFIIFLKGGYYLLPPKELGRGKSH